MGKGVQYAIGVIVVIVVLAGIAIYLSHSPSQSGQPTPGSSSPYNSNGSYSAGNVSTPILITDPPAVPAGTTALVITYTSVQVQASGTTGSGWATASGSGTLNLMALLNTSQVMGLASLQANSTIEEIRFNVSSATITVNGTTSNVTLPGKTITAHISGEAKATANSGVLLDLSPTVATIYTSNSTVFVLVPSVRAILVGNQSVRSSAGIGSQESLSSQDKTHLEDTKPNISIVSASLAVHGNTTDLSVTVKDNSNSSVDLKHVLLFGNTSVFVTQNASVNGTEHFDGYGGLGYNLSANASAHGNAGENESSVNMNASANASGHMHIGEAENAAEVGKLAAQMKVFNFFMSTSSTTLSLPSVSNEAEQEAGGYNLTAGSTATFTFNGTISMGEGHITMVPVSGSAYSLVVKGEGDASVAANVTAS